MKLKYKIAPLVTACAAISALAVSTLSFIFSNQIIDGDSAEIINNSCEQTASGLDAYLRLVEESVDTLADYALANLKDFDAFKASDAYVDEYSAELAPVLLSAAEHTEGAISVYIRYSPDCAYPTSGVFYMRNDGNSPYEIVENTDFSIYDKNDLNHVGWYYIPVGRGVPTWMDPYMNDNVGIYMISYVIPLFVDGENFGILGMDIDFSLIAEIADRETFYSGSEAFVLGSNNTILHHKNIEYGTMLSELDIKGGTVKIGSAVSSGKATGDIIDMSYGGQKYHATFRPMRNGMNIITAVPSNEVSARGQALRVSITTASIIIIIIAGTASMIISTKISAPIDSLNKAVKQIADGNLDTEIRVQSNDEIGTLAENFSQTAARLNEYVGYISEISFVLDEISEGNLAFELTKNYVGDFAKIKDSLENISHTLNETMSDINSVAEQVALGSEQVSAGAQALAQSSTEQTSSIQDLSIHMDELTRDVARNNEHIRGAFSAMEATFAGITESSRDMSDMHSAMNEISDVTNEISNIVSTVEDIAFQTNVLAINAAIEAARAGEFGRGFTVVSEEIQLLATKTAASTGDIKQLVENVQKSVQNGRQISIKADDSLKNVAGTSESVKTSLQDIYESSDKQAQAIERVNEGIKEITEAVQNNSATAEESAASSEQMSSQANLLSDRISMFKLKGR